MGSSRGRAGNAGMISQGYGGSFVEVVQAIARRIFRGSSSKKKQDDYFVISAKLIEVNGNTIKKEVSGTVRMSVGEIRSLVTEYVAAKKKHFARTIDILFERAKKIVN